VTKKGLGTRDSRQEPDNDGSESFRVDRVFVPPRPSSPSIGPQQIPPRRPTGRTLPPSSEAADAELALRRQLSRLQRQLAEAQRELANKDDELAAEVERRLEVTSAAEALQREHLELLDRSHELDAYKARTEGVEQRLQDAVAAADELSHQLERERAERGTLAKQFEDANGAFERARQLWKDESTLMQEHHASELAHAEAQKRAAVEALEQQLNGALERQRQTHESEVTELKSAHDRSVAALRGELEPKVAVARNLSEEIERLTSQLTAAKAEHVRDVTERVELHKWEMQQQIETHAAQLATEVRHHQAELTRRDEEIEAKTVALAQAERNSELREQQWEHTASGLRDSQKKLQQELSDAREKIAQADATRASVEQRLTATIAQSEKLGEEIRQLREKLESVEAQARHNALDRQRFVAYLEEGLAMLGAIPPNAESGPVRIPVPAAAIAAQAAQVQAAQAQAAPAQAAQPAVLPVSAAKPAPGSPSASATTDAPKST
jgi:chromosome segregation ATPase